MMSRHVHACRFFHTYRDFQRESKAVQHPRLRHILPTVYLANENLDENAPGGILQAPNGFKFPSFLVMERGCSLAQWQQQQPLAFGAAISMLYSVSVLLQTMHHIGRTHRDIQPENILLTIQTQAWKLSDFGMAGAIGVLHAVSFSTFGGLTQLPFYLPPATLYLYACMILNLTFGVDETCIWPSLHSVCRMQSLCLSCLLCAEGVQSCKG